MTHLGNDEYINEKNDLGIDLKSCDIILQSVDNQFITRLNLKTSLIAAHPRNFFLNFSNAAF
jgi:hypothetical protein